MTAVAYEIVYRCGDRLLGARLAQRVDDVIGPTWSVHRSEEGPTWALTIEFPDVGAAGRFFDSDFYVELCEEVRRSCRSAVLVVPLGPVAAEDSGGA